MNKEFIPYEQALELKELGFDERCFGFYNPRHEISKEPLYEHTGGTFDNYNRTDYLVSAPLYQQAFRWFREKYDLFISIFHYENGYALNNLRRFDTHEEAEVALLTSLIELAESMV